MCNRKSSPEFGRSSQLFLVTVSQNCQPSLFFCYVPEPCHLSLKNSSLLTPGKISRFPEVFCFLPKQALFGIVIPRGSCRWVPLIIFLSWLTFLEKASEINFVFQFSSSETVFNDFNGNLHTKLLSQTRVLYYSHRKTGQLGV